MSDYKTVHFDLKFIIIYATTGGDGSLPSQEVLGSSCNPEER